MKAAEEFPDYRCSSYKELEKPKKYCSNILIHVCLFILAIEFAERLGYYGINQGLKTFLHNQFKLESASAASLKSTWTAVCYLSPIFGAWIADEKYGRYKAILIFSAVYFVGAILLAIGALPSFATSSWSKSIFFIGLFGGIGISTGVIKATVAPFGADQFDSLIPEQAKQQQYFFSLFFWVINIGALISYGYLSNLSINGSGIIPKEYGYFATYLLCAFVMLLALLVFFIGSTRFRHTLPSKNSLRKLIYVIWKNTETSLGAKFIAGGFLAFLMSFVLNLISAMSKAIEVKSDYRLFSIFAGIFAVIGVISWIIFGYNPSYLDKSKHSNGGSISDETVDNVKLVVRILPWAATDVIWNCVYDQTDTGFQSIVQQCDLRFGNLRNSPQLPSSTLGIFNIITILLMIPILENGLYPLYTKIFKRKPSNFGKCSVGLSLATLAMFWTGLFEIFRRNSGFVEGNECYPLNSNDCVYVIATGSKLPMSKMPWTATIFQYLLVGTAECLINITAYDIYYSYVPKDLKSTSQSINLLMISMGANVASIFSLLFQSYLPHNLNEGNAEYMFFTMGGVSMINTIIFIVVMIKMQFGVHNSSNQLEIQSSNLFLTGDLIT